MKKKQKVGLDKAQHQSELSAARWQGVVSSAQDAIISIDAAGLVTLFSEAAERIFGYDAAEVLGQNVKLLMPAAYRDEHDGYIEAYRKTGVPKAIGKIRKVEGRRKNGETFPIELSVSEVHIDGDVLYTAVIRDVTERVQAEAALRDSEAKIRAIVDTAVDAIITIDEVGTIESFNRGAERLFGYETAEVLGQNVKLLMPTPYRDEHDGYLASYVRGGAPKIIGIGRQVVGLRKDGTTFPVDLAVSEVRLKDRRVFTGILRDLTERRAAETWLETLEEELSPHGPLATRGALATRANELLATLHRLDGLVREFVGLATSLEDTPREPSAEPQNSMERQREEDNFGG